MTSMLQLSLGLYFSSLNSWEYFYLFGWCYLIEIIFTMFTYNVNKSLRLEIYLSFYAILNKHLYRQCLQSFDQKTPQCIPDFQCDRCSNNLLFLLNGNNGKANSNYFDMENKITSTFIRSKRYFDSHSHTYKFLFTDKM